MHTSSFHYLDALGSRSRLLPALLVLPLVLISASRSLLLDTIQLSVHGCVLFFLIDVFCVRQTLREACTRT